jgi:Leucine-rich repeat (LRR) protein
MDLLQSLDLSGNDLTRIPTGALKGPKALRFLNFASNRLGELLPRCVIQVTALLIGLSSASVTKNIPRCNVFKLFQLLVEFELSLFSK